MSSLVASDTSSTTSSSSARAPTFSVYSNASTSPRYDLISPANSQASSSSMHNHASSFMSRSSTSSQILREVQSIAASPSLLLSSPKALTGEDRRRKVVGISVVKSSLAKDDFFQDKFLTGDIVQRVAISENEYFSAPFTAGKRGLLGELHDLHESGVSILTIQVVRGKREITRRALIVPMKKKHKYVLQDYEEPSHTFSFEDYTLESCLSMQDKELKHAQEQLSKMQITAVDVAYAWEQKMESVDGAQMVYSMLVVPNAYADIRKSKSASLEDTVLQAITWLHASEASGVPLIFHSIQTEPLITEDLEHSLNADLSSIVSSDMYTLQQPQGLTDRRVVMRAVRIWFAFHFSEVKIELEAGQGEALLGVTIGRTIEGFCYVTEVLPQTAAHRMGLKERLDVAKAQGMKLVVTKVCNESVLPWFVSNGNIRCYDINSISRKLSAHRHAGKPACLHLLDIRETANSTDSEVPGPMLTTSFAVERKSNKTGTSASTL